MMKGTTYHVNVQLLRFVFDSSPLLDRRAMLISVVVVAVLVVILRCSSPILCIFNHSDHVVLELFKINHPVPIVVNLFYQLQNILFVSLWVHLVSHLVQVAIGEALCDLIFVNQAITVVVKNIEGCLQIFLINQLLFVTGCRQELLVADMSIAIIIHFIEDLFPRFFNAP